MKNRRVLKNFKRWERRIGSKDAATNQAAVEAALLIGMSLFMGFCGVSEQKKGIE
ncbi:MULTISPECIES: hypothetical protein [Leptolyngbya]|uniref:hypothetical protein n=1 Tax=Leptolyngbya TaxID=47251 RepID=UPI001686A05D|nr:hypothetical protein [Leptolyngbya sp. FACHB-1624]MBD1857699.1 hypothetical protein [Leptolyngbya sp. FACHB-1624]